MTDQGQIELFALLQRVNGAVAVDTGLGHLAAALAVPTISLYGPTSTRLVGAYGRNQVHLQSPLAGIDNTDPAARMQAITPAATWRALQAAMADTTAKTTPGMEVRGREVMANGRGADRHAHELGQPAIHRIGGHRGPVQPVSMGKRLDLRHSADPAKKLPGEERVRLIRNMADLLRAQWAEA